MATVTEPQSIAEVDLSGLPEEALYEVINGRAVEKKMGSYSLAVASILHEYLGPYVRQAGLGRSIVELIIRVDAKTQYRPDVAFISHEKWPVNRRAPNKVWDIAPDVVIEVISPSDRAWKVLDKTRDYFDAGCRAVWLIFPSLEVVHLYESFTQIRVLTRKDDLEGGEIIPGFRLPLDTLFQGEPVEEDAEEDPAD